MHGEHKTKIDIDTPNNLSEQEVLALLQYMLHHNEHHAYELKTHAIRLEALDKREAATQVLLACDEYTAANHRLAVAIEMLGE